MALSRGQALALLGAGLFVVVLVVGAATAPSRTVAGAEPVGTPTANGTAVSGGTDTASSVDPRTLVGVQGKWVGGGNVRAYSGTTEEWRESSADSYFEVSMLPDDTVLAASADESASDCGDYESPCARTGFRHIDPTGTDGPGIVAEYSFPVKRLTDSEVHAVDHVSDDEYVFVDMADERVVVVENGTTAWQWNASQRYDAPPDPTARDWLHINDVDVIDEDRFLVSVRNANQLVVLERGEGVVEVVNEDRGTSDESCLASGRLDDFDGADDGDVRCGDPSVISEQHNPQWLGPGAVMVADSGNDRVVELQRTEDGSWEPAWVLREAGGIELDWPRDADVLPNGNVLVTDSLNRRVFEVTREGRVVWSISTGEPGDNPHIPYEADRLPYGEMAGPYEASPDGTDRSDDTVTLETADGNGTDVADTGSSIPGLTLAVAGLRGTFSWVPVWFGEFHLAVTVLALGLVVGGGVDHWRNPDRPLQRG
ncbi:hypothetical protein BRC64_03465 [Halobacteriales archaeon QH_10_67_22]|nr:MAG: hypothetical protein BRC64_03465 [Halobacteriales archaeon QH_10_67_22]